MNPRIKRDAKFLVVGWLIGLIMGLWLAWSRPCSHNETVQKVRAVQQDSQQTQQDIDGLLADIEDR